MNREFPVQGHDEQWGIFVNRDVLGPTYVPEKILHREAQIRGLATKLSVALKGEDPL